MSSVESLSSVHRAEAADLPKSSRHGNPNESRAAIAQRIALAELPPVAPSEDEALAVRDLHPLHQIKTRLQVCVGHATLSVGELLGAREHQVVPLDRGLDAPVDLILEGQVVARGELIAVDGHFAVRITELPMSLQLGTVAAGQAGH